MDQIREIQELTEIEEMRDNLKELMRNQQEILNRLDHIAQELDRFVSLNKKGKRKE